MDTIAGMLVSNLIALAIMIATAATLHPGGRHQHQHRRRCGQRAEAHRRALRLCPVRLGIIGTGLLAIPVLAGSTGYAVAEARGWKTGPGQYALAGARLLSVIGAAMLLGLGIDWSPIDPIKALYWSAVLNGVDRGADDGGDDVCGRQPQQDGRIPRRAGAGRAGLAFHRGDGGGGGHHDICELN